MTLDGDDVAAVLFRMRRKGVMVWDDRGALRYRAPPGAVTAEDIEKLRALSRDIIDFLQRRHQPADDFKPVSRRNSDRVPLTFSQQWLWNENSLDKRGSTRGVGAAVRLRGPLKEESLRRSLKELVRRHESLRTTIDICQGAPSQTIHEQFTATLEVVDLTKLLPGDREVEARRIATRLATERFSLAAGPLFLPKLIRMSETDCEKILAVAMDHIISDAVSVGVVFRELFSMYAQALRGLSCSLPGAPVQFADYAVWQHEENESWLQRHAGYWQERLAGAERVRLFPYRSTPAQVSGRLATIPVTVTGSVSDALRELGRSERTTLAMTVLTVYAALIMRWCNRTDVVIPFITMGRVHQQLQSTIGFFGSPLFLRIEISDRASFLDLLRHVTRAYAAAYEHDDSCRIATQIPQAEFAWNPCFNWIPEEFGMDPSEYLNTSELGRTLCSQPFTYDLLSHDDIEQDFEPRLVVSDTKWAIGARLAYRADCCNLTDMECFVRNLYRFAEKFVSDPTAPVLGISCER